MLAQVMGQRGGLEGSSCCSRWVSAGCSCGSSRSSCLMVVREAAVRVKCGRGRVRMGLLLLCVRVSCGRRSLLLLESHRSCGSCGYVECLDSCRGQGSCAES